ncbi:MAG: TatD family hydrolase [Clostridia bacterium]|nr:TatD family hydrolase [Clostridia bacterium]
MSYCNIFDTHAHYDDERFDTDRDELLSSLHENGVSGIINCGCDAGSSLFSRDLSEKYDFVYFAAGIHPQEVDGYRPEDLRLTEALTEHEKCVAVGEIGLDYHYGAESAGRQRELFEAQVRFAAEKGIPVIVHDREAHADTLDILKKYRPGGVMHCYSGSVEMAEEIMKLGMYIGIGGSVTFRNARRPVEVAAVLPEDRLLLETDCPYMSPVPFRGKRCSSDLIAYTAEKIAEIRGTDAQHIIDAACENAKALFNISK